MSPSKELLDYIRNNNYVAIDIETTGLNYHTDKVIGVALQYPESSPFYLDIDNKALSFVLESPIFAKVFHNANFDIKFLQKHYSIKGPIIDTLLLAQLIDENQPLDLKSLALKYISADATFNAKALYKWLEDNKLQKKDIHSAPQELIEKYALEDVKNTYHLARIFTTKLDELQVRIETSLKRKKNPITYFQEEAMPLEEVLRNMETQGITVNTPAITNLQTELLNKQQEILKTLKNTYKSEIEQIIFDLHEKEKSKRKSDKGKERVKFPEFNWNSNEQVGNLFFYHILPTTEGYDPDTDPKLQFAKTATGKWKCSEFVFDFFLKHKTYKDIYFVKVFCENYLAYIKLKKQLGTDIKGLLERTYEGKIYPSFKQIGIHSNEANGTVTGRLSSANPNLQNIPPFARHFYIPDTSNEVFIYFDYSQIELRLAAQVSGDKRMIELFNAGVDLHTKTAQAIFKKTEITADERQVAKTSNFLFIYNGSPHRFKEQLSQDHGINISIKEATDFKEAFFKENRDYKAYLGRQKEQMLKYKMVISPFGRIRRLPELKYHEGLNYQRATYQGENALRQELTVALEQLKEKDKHKLNKSGDKIPKDIYDLARAKVGHAFNQGYNFPIQSMAASLMKRSMIYIHKMGYIIKNQVHDSIIIQTHKNKINQTIAECKEVLENVVKLSIPLVAEPKVLRSFSEKDIYEQDSNEDTRAVS